MSLVTELKERRTAVSAEMDRLEEEGRGIDRQWKEQERLFGDLDTAIRALDPTDPPTAEEMFGNVTNEQPELFEDEKAVAREQLEREDDASEFAEPMPDPEFIELDEQTCEPVEEAPALNEAMQDEREQPVEGYAPVTNPEADFWARGIEQPKPEPFRLASIFRREKEDA